MTNVPAASPSDADASMPDERRGPRPLEIVLYLIAGAGLLASALTLDDAYWLDEVLTVKALDGSYLHMLQHRIQGGHQPLYFTLAWLWGNLFGLGEVALRSLSWVILAAGVVLAAVVARLTINRTAGGIAAALAALSPQLLYFSQLVRPYVLMATLSLALVLTLLLYARQRTRARLVLVAASSLLLLLTHNATVFAIVPLMLACLFWRTLWPAALAQLAALLAWTPWALWCKSHYTFHERLHWVPPADARALLIGVANLTFDGPSLTKLASITGALAVWACVNLGLIALAVVGVMRLRSSDRLIAAAYFGPLACGVVAMLFFDSDLFPSVRYFAPLIAVAPVLLAAAVTPTVGPRWWRWGQVIAACGLLLVAAAASARALVNPKHASSWREVAAVLAERAAPGEPVLAVEYPEAVPVAFYADRPVDVLEPEVIERPRAWYATVNPRTTAELVAANPTRVWIVLSQAQWGAYDDERLPPNDHAVLDALREAYGEPEAQAFPAGGLLLYERN